MRPPSRAPGGGETRALMRRALAALEADRPGDAEALCRAVLARDPRSDRALHLLGVLASRRRDHQAAAAHFGAAARLRPDPRHLRDWAGALERLGQPAEAAEAWRAAIALDPEDAEAQAGHGAALRRLGRLEEAEAALRRAVHLAPGRAEPHNALGRTLLRLGRLAEAAEAFRTAVALGLDTAAAHADLGLALARTGRLPEAVAALQEAVRREPGDADAFSNLGVALSELGRRDEAAAVLSRAIALRPDHANAHANLGLVLAALDRPEEAVAACGRALGLRPDHANAHANLGVALLGLARFEEAVAAFERAIALEPGHPAARLNLALALLLLGRFERGWEAYEHRWLGRRPPAERREVADRPQWRGEPLDGRTILLHAEQGLGDAIQFARYAPEVARRGAGRVLLLVHPLLRRLLADLPGVDGLLTFGEALPPFDLQCPLLSLPCAFRTTPDTIPARAAPYLRAEPAAAARWRDRLGGLPPGLRVGLAWAGNAEHGNDRNRSVAFGRLAPLWRAPGVSWVGLQVGPRAADLAGAPEGLVLDAAPMLGDLAETAAAMAALDLVLSVDTAVAHLAGALGRPAWVMLPLVPDWRWLLGREDSPWYPTMRLFRQERRGDWDGVVARVAAALDARVEGGRTRPFHHPPLA